MNRAQWTQTQHETRLHNRRALRLGLRMLLATIHREVKPVLDTMKEATDKLDGRQIEDDKQGWTAPGHLAKYHGQVRRMHEYSPDKGNLAQA